MNGPAKNILALIIIPGLSMLGCRTARDRGEAKGPAPNILFVIADDQSYPHASAYGMPQFPTPAFDEIAARGVLFTNAFVAAPQCSPSRAAILTGRNIWQLEEAGTHSSYFPAKFPVFTDVLEASGYFTGYTGKGWGPGNWKDAGWPHNPAGKEFNALRFETVPYSGINKIDYAANFESFLKEKPVGKPFFFWFGAHEPHRNYEFGSGRKAFPGAGEVTLPAFLPKTDSVATDWLDYALEISWFDQQLSKMVSMLEQSDMLDNTIIVVTADNGMPFPYAKANLQEYGIHVPLAICGPSVKGHRRVDDLVSLIDLAPTFLELSRAAKMDGMTGKSLMPLLQNDDSGVLDTTRQFIFAGRERHTHARPDNAGYPARAIRTKKYLYVWNMKPDRWPVGDPPPENASYDLSEPELKPIIYGYEDVDDSPSKEVMLEGKDRWPETFKTVFSKRPQEQLYDVVADPECMHDLSSDRRFSTVRDSLLARLLRQLRSEGDPRVSGNGDVFDGYPRFGRMRPFAGFRERGKYNRFFGGRAGDRP